MSATHSTKRGRLATRALGLQRPEGGCLATPRANQRLVDNLSPGEVALYLDKLDVHLNPKFGPECALTGEQRYVRTPGCNEKRYPAGALDPRTGKLTWGRARP
jgi:hypothetical protein